jgi:hypothetical protein
MNIFVLDNNPQLAARYHADTHAVKMILESAQMLCAAHWIGWQRMLKPPADLKRRELQAWLEDHVPEPLRPPWKMTHVNHPCTRWTQFAWGNYMWHSRLGLALCAEYEARYGRVHKSLEVHRWLNRLVPPTFESATDDPVGITPFALAMPDDCKVEGDAVQSYRNYYNRHKARIARWKHSETPAWWNPSETI